MKKLLSVVLSLIMVVSCVSVMAFATQDRAAVEITVTPVAGTYNKGDIVTFEVFYEGSEEEYQLAAPTSIGFGFDSRVFEMLEDCTAGVLVSNCKSPIFIYEGYAVENATVSAPNSWVKNGKGANDADTAKGWDSWCSFKINSQNVFQDYSTKTASFAFRLKIKDDADLVNGSLKVGISDYYENTEDININDEYSGIFVNGMTTDDFGFTGVSKIFSYVDGEVNVATAAASIVKYSKAQIRFQGIGADKDKTNYKNAFDVRTVAKISQDDFVATFTDEANAKAKITDFGFVYAAKSNVADFSVDTAKAVAEGGSAENYVKKSVTYMQHTGDGADYVFTCLITDIADTDANKADGVNCLAFVCFDGTYYYFDAAASVSYGDLYTTHFPA